jgi:hypothetical protein
MKTVILLTGCINPNGMSYTSLNNIEEREVQYVNAIRHYLKNTNYPVVFVENSGTDISYYFREYVESAQLECITLHGNQNKEKGKGYGECEIIRHAIENSRIILSSNEVRIVKITGRLIILNICPIIRFHGIFTSKRTTLCMINSDLSFPDSRIIMAHIDFYKEFLLYQEKINDSQGYFFEHALCDIIKNNRQYPFSPFFLHPQIIGISGSTGKQYPIEPTSCSFAIRYFRYAVSQLHQFNKLYR